MSQYVIAPEDSVAYITQRLMEIEVAIYRGPRALQAARDTAVVTEERYQRAKAKALLAVPIEADNGRKLTAAERDARAFLATVTEREAYQQAESVYEYARDVSRALDREKDSLQTRSANLRAEIQLSGKGH